MTGNSKYLIPGLLFILVFTLLINRPAGAAGPWEALQERIKEKTDLHSGTKEDPWEKLRAIYLPFTEAQETAALTEPAAGKKVSGYLHRVLEPYKDNIEKASRRFNIPPEIIGAVIMVESGGNPRAKAKTSTARGLMQTISSTFKEARKKLQSSGIAMANTPNDPHASIMAGSWYLDQMYRQAASDKKETVGDRLDVNSWRYPLEYYYAGPGNGKKENQVVIMYAGGRRVVIDKPAYSQKVLKWARIMRKS